MEKISSFYRKVSISLKLNHPVILKCIGYSLIDFKNKPKPTIVPEFTPEKNLDSTLQSQDQELNDTKKLINIFGIASAMAYLHSHNILHMNLNEKCIFLDENLYPKLSDFDHSREIANLSENQVVKEQKTKGTLDFLAPEVLSKLEYSKASDSYSFSILMYKLFQRTRYLDPSTNIRKGERPKFDKPIGEAYRKMIEKCWAQDPTLRPTFDQIVNELKTNPEFLIEKVDRDEFNKYIKFIDESHISFDERKLKVNLDEIMKQRTHTFIRQKVNICELSFDGNCIDLSQYKLEQSLNKNAEYETFRSRLCTSNEKKYFYTQVYSKEINCFNKHEMINFYRKINIISQLNHPAILSFVGWSPVHFNGKHKPVIISEYCDQNLNEIRNMFSIFNIDTQWNSTKKLICIYGIASAMSYLHSHDIIHRDLKPENIFLDNCFNLPKITGFDIAKVVKNGERSKKIKGSPAYLAPEVYSDKEYSKASDVYSFALVVYQILTGIKPFEDLENPEKIKDELLKNEKRPVYINPIGEAYRDLIERCWSQDLKDRPTFEQIVNELKTNPDFINDEIDKEDYFEYINFINDYSITFNSSKRIQQYDEIFERINTFEEAEPYYCLKNMYDSETNDLLFDYNFFNLDNYPFMYEDTVRMFYNVKVITNESETTTFVEKRVCNLENFSQSEHINFSRELDIIPKLNHPAILKYIGYCPDSCNYGIPILIMEFAPKKIETENLDLTKKSIIIYGVASAMAYLHSHNIIHRDLKLENVYLNESFYPKLSGFNISKLMSDNCEKSKNIKGTPAYLAPEIYSDKKYSKASDVYSFSFLIHELLTGKKLFEKTTSPKQISEELINNFKRPEFDETVNDAYRDLIERCWSQDPKMRPTFDCIVEELRTNSKFILENVNQEEFYSYIKLVEEASIL